MKSSCACHIRKWAEKQSILTMSFQTPVRVSFTLLFKWYPSIHVSIIGYCLSDIRPFTDRLCTWMPSSEVRCTSIYLQHVIETHLALNTDAPRQFHLFVPRQMHEHPHQLAVQNISLGIAEGTVLLPHTPVALGVESGEVWEAGVEGALDQIETSEHFLGYGQDVPYATIQGGWNHKAGYESHNSYSASHNNWCTSKLLNRIITAQWEGMRDVGLARYEPTLLPPPCLTIRVVNYNNYQRSTHSIS